jgi:hypothetical protein
MARCPVCRDLRPSDDQLEESLLMRKTLNFHVISYLDELHETAQKGCILCSILHEAGSHFADRFWGKYNPKCARLDFWAEMPWVPPATVQLTLEANGKGSEEGQKAWVSSRPTGTEQFVPIDFEIYRKEGMCSRFDLESDF